MSERCNGGDMEYNENEEKTLLLDRSYTCPICDKKIKAKSVKSNTAKFVDTCADLRPIHSNVNVTKYEVVSCCNCGYTAFAKTFSSTTQTQRKLIREGIQANFKSHEEVPCDIYTTEQAISRLKMALLCAVTKNGKDSEVGNICLKLNWLYQDIADELDENDPEYEAKKENYLSNADSFAMKAYDLLTNARMTEDFPIAGMTETTLDYLLAYLGYKKGEYSTAMQYLSGVVTSKSTSPRLKDKSLELKELLNQKLHGDESTEASEES